MHYVIERFTREKQNNVFRSVLMFVTGCTIGCCSKSNLHSHRSLSRSMRRSKDTVEPVVSWHHISLHEYDAREEVVVLMIENAMLVLMSAAYNSTIFTGSGPNE